MRTAEIDSFRLKIIALFAMTMDHVAYVFFPKLLFLRFIGRLAFPIYAFMISEGFDKTRDIRKYEGRIFFYALASAIPFYLVFRTPLNVFFTLFGGLAALDISERLKNKWAGVACMIAIALLTIDCDWGFVGVVGIYVYGKIKNHGVKIVWGTISIFLLTFIKWLIEDIIKGRGIYLSTYWILAGVFLAIPVLFMYSGKKGYKIKHLFYIYYPAHLMVIAFVMRIIKLFK